jgi:hypothetical protein
MRRQGMARNVKRLHVRAIMAVKAAYRTRWNSKLPPPCPPPRPSLRLLLRTKFPEHLGP